jgi:hypothetical protein
MDNPDKLATQDTGRRQTKQWTICVHCQSIWIVHCVVCLCPVSCVASLSGLSIVLFVFVLCLVLAVYLDCPLFCLSSSCVLCALPVYLDMDNRDKLTTQDTGRRQTKQWTIQKNWQHKTHDEDKQNNGQSR